MDFFEHQHVARRKTGRLVVLFLVAVTGIVTATYIALASVITYYSAQEEPFQPGMLWNVELLVWTSLGVVLVIFLGSLYKTAMLRAGGRAVAEALGGVLVDRESGDGKVRRLLNVVEEMALASGTAVPPVYVLDEEGINAFAAGFSPDDAVIGVTRGTVERLSRDELQGVIAHEFSHILNGDMRLNIRLIGVIHGILVIGLIGWVLLRSAMYSGAVRSRRSDRGNPLPLILLGVALMVIGFLGMFFGNLIKAAVSRQREFLADSSAVQFTRNPGGIGGALRKIAGFEQGSRVENPQAAEVSHMFFSQGFTSWLGGLLATHPPLAERIRRIDPALADGSPAARPQRRRAPGLAASAAGFAAGAAGTPAPEAPPVQASALSLAGQPAQAHLDYARQVIEGLPEPLRIAAHETYGARAVVYALLLDPERKPRKKQLRHLEQHADRPVYEETRALQPLAERLDRAARLPLVEMALASLRELSASQYEPFRENVVALIRADDEVDAFEWLLHRLIIGHLEPQFTPRRKPAVRHRSLRPVLRHSASLLSVLAHAGHDDAGEAERAFQEGASHLGVGRLESLPRERSGFENLEEVLDELGGLAPRRKRQVLEACAACIAADRQITVDEAELFRAVSSALDCPVPPIFPGQPLA